MTRKLLAWVLQVALPLAAVFAVTATPVSAHEERATGGFRLEVGWGDEPAYTGPRCMATRLGASSRTNRVT